MVEEFLSYSPAAYSSDLLDAYVHSLNESCDLANSALLALSQKEQDVAVEGDEMLMEPSQPACPAYEKLLEVVAHTTERLDLPCKCETPQIALRHSDKHFFWLAIQMQLL